MVVAWAMNLRTTRRLVLPASLAVTTLLLSCKDPSDEPYCSDIAKMSDCELAEHCGWDEQFGECVNTCYTHETQQECEAIAMCIWEPDSGGDTGGSGTGGPDGFCHEPFT